MTHWPYLHHWHALLLGLLIMHRGPAETATYTGLFTDRPKSEYGVPSSGDENGLSADVSCNIQSQRNASAEIAAGCPAPFKCMPWAAGVADRRQRRLMGFEETTSHETGTSISRPTSEEPTGRTVQEKNLPAVDHFGNAPQLDEKS